MLRIRLRDAEEKAENKHMDAEFFKYRLARVSRLFDDLSRWEDAITVPTREEDENPDVPSDPQSPQPRGSYMNISSLVSLVDSFLIMPPRRARPLTQAAIDQLIQQRVDAAIAAERERVANGKSWTEMKTMMTEEFCPPEEIQRLESELWNLKVKDYDINAYTACFNELVLLCPKMVSTEKKKIRAYIRSLSNNIKGEVTSSEPTTLNAIDHMARKGSGKTSRVGAVTTTTTLATRTITEATTVKTNRATEGQEMPGR
ncbi:reverse transcriptase domain-containing protein [Tanacetum coccineum]